MALGLLLASALALYVFFSAGQVLATKHRLINTADAAAFGAANWRARVLNYHAYSNRAIVANEVAIAQAVTLTAWADYFETLTSNTAALGSLLPPLRPLLQGAAELATTARQLTRAGAQAELVARGAPVVGFKEILQVSQEILHLTANGFGLNTVAAEVARANHPDYFGFVLPDLGDFYRLTRRHSSDADRSRLAGVVLDSLDPFTAGPRVQDLWTPIVSPCLNFMRIRKRGQTQLAPTLDRWEAVDTLSFHVRTLRWNLSCREREALPLAWGSAEAVRGEATRSLSHASVVASINPWASELAGYGMESLRGYAGIARTRDLDYEALDHAPYPTNRLAVVVRQRGAQVRTAQRLKQASGRVLPLDRYAGDSTPYVWALSAAEIHFRRPPDAPARVEYASLYSPYWQVRLIEPSTVQRAAAMAYAY